VHQATYVATKHRFQGSLHTIYPGCDMANLCACEYGQLSTSESNGRPARSSCNMYAVPLPEFESSSGLKSCVGKSYEAAVDRGHQDMYVAARLSNYRQPRIVTCSGHGVDVLPQIPSSVVLLHIHGHRFPRCERCKSKARFSLLKKPRRPPPDLAKAVRHDFRRS
jgi:hypothetical protein